MPSGKEQRARITGVLGVVLTLWVMAGCGSEDPRGQPLAPDQRSLAPDSASIGSMADAQLLLNDLDLTFRIAAAADQAVYLLLDAAAATRQASGAVHTTGRLTPIPEGGANSFAYDARAWSSSELVLDNQTGPDILLTFGALDHGLGSSWPVPSDVNFPAATGRVSGRIVVPGRTDLRVSNTFRMPDPASYLTYDRQLEGWTILPGVGFLRLRARISGSGTTQFHGFWYGDSVTAVVQLADRELIINESISRFSANEPAGPRRGSNGSTQQGSREVRIGSRRYRWPGIDIERNYDWNPYGIDRVGSASHWRSLGNVSLGNDLFASLGFGGPVIEGAYGGPPTILTLIDSTIVAATPPPVTDTYVAFPWFFGGGRTW